jgi:hypothetical protein
VELHRLEYNPAEGASDSDPYCEIPETKGVNSYVQLWMSRDALFGLDPDCLETYMAGS